MRVWPAGARDVLYGRALFTALFAGPSMLA